MTKLANSAGDSRHPPDAPKGKRSSGGTAPYLHESRYDHGGPLVGVSYSQTWKYIPPSRRT
ncbi:TPA: hypothetical protein EYO63_06395 [Candidatus Poribacteria bacterium]|nr:hypothetical protein [Candidatus Poribacteria bacterium]